MKKTTFQRIHVSYYVSDIQHTVEFYTKFFETEPVKVKENYAKFLLEEPSLNISFIQHADKVNPTGMHYGIEVNEPESLKQRLGNAMHLGLPVDVEKEVKCCYAKQDKFWVTDPDGYRWEVFQFIEDSEVLSEETDSACCAA